MQVYIYSVVSMGVMAAIMAIGLGFASKVFKVEQDQRVKEIEEILPTANCGACGYAGCSDFAEAVIKGEAEIDGCPVGGQEVADKIAEILDKESNNTEKQTAQRLCDGAEKYTTKKGEYKGVKTCKAAETINGGTKTCKYGCLSFGDCVTVCPFAAIEINEDGLPEIDEDKCTACGKCIEACPRDILILAPFSSENHIRCCSHAPGSTVKRICEVGCIGCGICAKICPVEAIDIENNLAVLDYEKCIDCGLCSEKCPTGTIEFNGQKIKEIKITDECVGCTLCADKCPVDAIEGELKKKHTIDQEKCIKCGLCYQVCNLEGAIDKICDDN